MIKHWINGREVESKDVFVNYNPATGEAIGEVASGGAEEVAQAVAAAKEAFPKWANTPAKERARLMRKLGELIEQNVPKLAELETLDTGLPIHQTKNVLIPRASHNFDFLPKFARGWTAIRIRSTTRCSTTPCTNRWVSARWYRPGTYRS